MDTAAADAAAPGSDPLRGTLAALVTDTRLAEISGMARSLRHPGVLWAHNDSGDVPRLLAIDSSSGAVRGSLLLEGEFNLDWEDMASFEHQGTAYLLVADTGDNGGIRGTLSLHLVEEPGALGDDVPVRPVRSVRFRWPDGPRDCEAVAVDAEAGYAYLVAKKRVPPQLLRVPLHEAGDSVVVAEAVGTLAGVVQPSAEDLERNPVYGRYRAQVTAADLSSDGLRLAVLNYRTAYVYQRARGEDWASAVARAPLELALPWLPQAEALAFDGSGAWVWVSSEKLPAPLLRVPLPAQP